MRTRPGCEVLIDSDDAIRAKHLKRVHAIALGVSIVLAGPIGLLLMPIGVVIPIALFFAIEAVGRKKAPAHRFADLREQHGAAVSAALAHQRRTRGEDEDRA